MMPALLRQLPHFRGFWIGQTVSLFGDQVSLFALPLIAVLVLHATAAQMGLLTAAMLAPNLLFSLHFGAWIDRRGRRRQAMIAADVGRAALIASIPAAYVAGVLTLGQLLVVGFLTGTLSVVFFVSYSTLVTSLVPPGRYVEANQLLNGSRAFAFVAGPSSSGALVQLLSAPVAMVVDAVSYLFSAFFTGRIAAAEPPREQSREGQLAAGVRFIRGSALLRCSLACTATINLFTFVFTALFILYATRDLHVRPGTLGAVLGAGAVGGLIGSTVTGRIARGIGIGPALVVGAFLFPAPLALVPLAAGSQPLVLALLFVAEFCSGFGVMLLDITLGSIQQALIPDRLRARVSGAYNVVNYGVRPLGALLGGALGASIGLRPTLWIASVGATLGALFLLRSPAPSMRALPRAAT